MKRTLAATAALVVVAAGATACGAGSGVETGAALLSALSKASDKAQQAGSADVDARVDFGTGEVAMSGTYTWGENGDASDLMMDAAASGMTDLVSGSEVRMLLVDGAYYYNVDPQPSGPLQGKHWMKIDASVALGEQGASALSSADMDPMAGLKEIKDAEDVTEVGEENVLGRETTHYKAEMPVGPMGEDKNGMLGKMLDSADTMTVELWLDAEDMPVRMKSVVGPMKMTMDYLKFGTAKKISAPAASDTADMTAFVKEQMQGS
ncbi:hypothetical protein [Streptomyces mesophilus]|uniref:hypothetical protein n=1 Tax=Streptomyces mesophilus TaxID=1775132 RepID=UPI00333042A2